MYNSPILGSPGGMSDATAFKSSPNIVSEDEELVRLQFAQDGLRGMEDEAEERGGWLVKVEGSTASQASGFRR